MTHFGYGSPFMHRKGVHTERGHILYCYIHSNTIPGLAIKHVPANILFLVSYLFLKTKKPPLRRPLVAVASF